MLQVMRELAKSWVFKSLMALLVVSFAIWGIGDMFRGNPAQRTVAQVGKIKIPVQLVEVRFQAELPRAREAFGMELTPAQARQYGVLDRVLKVIMEEYSFDQEAARLGVNVSQDYVLFKLAQEPKLRDKDGKFNEALWRQIIGKSGLSERLFFDVETKAAARQIILSALTSNMEPPKLIIDNLYRARGDKRVMEVITLRNDSLKNAIPTPKDEELEAYYKAHENEFVAPEYRAITVAKLSGETIVKDVTVSEEDIRQAYDSRKEELSKPETRDLIQIVVQDEGKAKAIAEAAMGSKNLATAAKAKNLTPINMTAIDEKNILPDLYASVFSLDEGQVSQPIKSSLGWHVVQVKAIHSAGLPSYEAIKDQLRTMVQEERAGDFIAKTVNQLNDALAGGQALEDIADSLKLHLSRYAALDNTAHDATGKEITDIPAKDITLPAAFSLESGETGQVLEDGKGDYYVVRADRVTPSQTRPLAEVKGKVQTAWMSDQLAEKASASAEEIAQALREGKTATSFASRPGVEIRLSKPISLLGDTDKDIPEMGLAQAIRMQKGDVTTASAPGKQYVLRLADIVPVDPNKPESSRLKVVEELREKMPHNMVDQYSIFLHDIFPVSINQDVFASLKNRSDSNE